MVIINDHIGEDNGVELRYGKNIPEDGMSQEVDMREVVTRIYPKAYNGWTMTNSSYVDSPLINSYPTIKIATITFEDVKMREDAREGDEEEGIIVCDTQEELDAALKEKCNQQFEAGLDKPKVTISADMILLQNTEQYKDYAVLENVSLGDTIHCINNHLGITTTARVISLVYDSILKKVDSVVIGEAEYNYFNNVTSSVNRIDSAIRLDGSVVAEQIKGFIDGTWSQLRIQNTAAKKQDVRAILFEDLDPDSETFGALSIGTQGLQISRRRTAANDDWIWTTALTAGGLIADIINGGTISGVKIVSPASMPNLRSDIVIENGVISSEGEILSINRSFQLYTGSLRFDVKWDDGTKQKAELNANGLYAFYGEEIDQNTITVAARDTGGIVQVSNKNGDYVSITPGHLTIFRDGKTIVEY